MSKMSITSSSVAEEKGAEEEKNDGPDLRNFPCRRPPHTKPRLYEFQRYLELTGATKALSQALGSLCAEKFKPSDPLRYVIEKMCTAGRVTKWSECVISLRNELSQLRTLVMYAQTENERCRAFLIRSGKGDLLEDKEEVEDTGDGEVQPVVSRVSIHSIIS